MSTEIAKNGPKTGQKAIFAQNFGKSQSKCHGTFFNGYDIFFSVKWFYKVKLLSFWKNKDMYYFWPLFDPQGGKIGIHTKMYAQNRGKMWNLATLHTAIGNPVAWNAYQVLLWNVIDEENQKFIATFGKVYENTENNLKIRWKMMNLATLCTKVGNPATQNVSIYT